MTPSPIITDHALLRYMERFYGVDTAAWREAMASDVAAALAAYRGKHERGQQAFVMSSAGRVVTVLDERVRFLIPSSQPAVAIPRIII
ncbi:hypothetical protein [Methylobacterium sp. J-092]|uniref:hypothetical protein n=1 Tax=Methylobacterium sp. J-092 TaxID=2836667 RepID=UPI001FBB6B4A|nr:hypothetical protein [Methylobacterium sp. J-092]MCJ2009792.1 hypothetical protein [Methylobacterium sp. J-092]